MISNRMVRGLWSARPKRDFWIGVLLVSGGLALSLRAVPARASCAAQPAKLVWSYPADGDVDVPTNAHFFYVAPLTGRDESFELNGRMLPTDHPEGPPYGLPLPLEPRTTYTLSLKLAAAGPTAATTLSVRFTTGAGPAPSGLPPTLAIDRVTAVGARDFTPVCREAWQAMDCFDTGQNTHVVFETKTRPTLFFVTPVTGGSSVPWTMTWPGSCGDPELFVSGPTDCRGPHRIYAVAHTGEAVTADVDCNPQPPALPGSSPSVWDASAAGGGGACAVGGSDAGASPTLAMLLAVALAGIARHRSRRARTAAVASAAHPVPRTPDEGRPER